MKKKDMQNNLNNISKYIEDAYSLAKQREMDNAIEHFFTLRMLLKTSVINDKIPYDTLQNHTKIFNAEAEKFKKVIQQNGIQLDTAKQILIIGDSLQLPRPNETKLDNGGIHLTTSYMMQETIEKENLNYQVNTWGQRYFTTDSLLKNWDVLIPEDLTNTHLIVHLGLNDYAERMFLEEERLALDLYPSEIKDKIVKFAQIYRKEIIKRQVNHSYVPMNQFKKNIIEIITRAKLHKAKSITFINIIALPSKTWEHTPRCMWNTSRFNMFLYEIEQEHNIKILDLDRFVWEFGLHEHLLPDKMHLSPKGHKLLADKILESIKEDK